MPRQTGKIRLEGLFVERKQASERHGLLPGGWWLWCLLGLAVGLAAWIGGRQFLRTQLSAQLDSAQTEQVALQSIEALLRLDGDAAIDVSRSLAHPEFMVANAAFRALSGQLDAWSRLDAAERLRRMAQIVVELERTPPNLDQDHRILINGLASRIYAETLSNRETGAADVLSSCKRILARREPAGSVAAHVTAIDTSSPREGSIGDVDANSPVPPPLPPLRELGQTTSSPVSSPVNSNQSSASFSDQRPASEAVVMPRMISNTTERVALSSGRATVQLTASPARQQPPTEARIATKLSDQEPSIGLANQSDGIDASGDSADTRDGGDDDRGNLEKGSPEDSADVGMLAGIDELPIDQLVRLLSSMQPRVTQAASLALRRKGMNDDKLALAMHLATGSSADRQELLQSLVQRRDLDPRPWLLWMAGDGDERVREQSVGLLSPLMDNDVRRQLRLLLNKERDERVAQTIRRVLVQ